MPVERRSSAALHMPYTTPPPPLCHASGGIVGWRAAREEMLRIQPDLRSFISGSTSWLRCSGAQTCTSIIRSNRLVGNSATGRKNVTAALLTSTSIGPNCSRTVATSRSRRGGGGGEPLAIRRLGKVRRNRNRLATRTGDGLDGLVNGPGQAG